MKRTSVLFTTALAALCLAAGLPGSAASAATKCRLRKFADIPVTMDGRQPMITLKVNGQDARFVLDTGAFYNLMTPSAARRLQLKTLTKGSIRMSGIGGGPDVMADVGQAREVTFGGAPVKNPEFIVGAEQIGDDGNAGLIGQNFLRAFDVELDMANAVVRLFSPLDCEKDGLAYWSSNGATIMPMLGDGTDGRIVARAEVNGRKVRVEFDTGSSSTILDLDSADKAGVPRDAGVEAGGVTGGVGKALVETWVAPIDQLDLGDEQIKKSHLRVGRLKLEGAEMLLGMDFFLSHRVMVSNYQGKIYFTYNGGPVFDIGRNKPKPGAATQVAAGDDKLTASELSRRASASLARRDAAAAAADLTRAAALEPGEPRYLVERARAHRMLGDRKAARADLDAALKLKPDDMAALRDRGYMRVVDDDLDGARLDFDAAVKAAPGDSDLRMSFASAYLSGDHYELAVHEEDEWLAEHPRDPNSWQVLNSRCWARAMWNHDLDKALADCDAALKLAGPNSEVLDNHGMIQLRLGHYQQSVADYDRALKAQSRNAWSYLGRGLAKEKLGDAAGARADIARAVQIDPDTAATARAAGFDSPLLPKAK